MALGLGEAETMTTQARINGDFEGAKCCIRCRTAYWCNCHSGLLWPKTYATVKQVERGDQDVLVVRTDDGDWRTISARWGCGGKGKRLSRGSRIKIYQRNGVPHVNFRMVGR